MVKLNCLIHQHYLRHFCRDQTHSNSPTMKSIRTVLILVILAVVSTAAQNYDPNSIDQNQKLLHFFLKIAFHIANRLVQLRELLSSAIDNDINSKIGNITVDELIEEIPTKINEKTNDNEEGNIQNNSTSELTKNDDDDEGNFNLTDIQGRFLSLDDFQPANLLMNSIKTPTALASKVINSESGIINMKSTVNFTPQLTKTVSTKTNQGNERIVSALNESTKASTVFKEELKKLKRPDDPVVDKLPSDKEETNAENKTSVPDSSSMSSVDEMSSINETESVGNRSTSNPQMNGDVNAANVSSSNLNQTASDPAPRIQNTQDTPVNKCCEPSKNISKSDQTIPDDKLIDEEAKRLTSGMNLRDIVTKVINPLDYPPIFKKR